MATVLLSVVSLLAIGCGSSTTSGSDFVFTGGSNSGAGTQNLTFQFVQAQAVEVPENTASLRFDLYDGPAGTGTLLFTQTEAFAPSITLFDVPLTVQSVVITAITQDGVPIGVLTADVNIAPETDNVVDLSNVNFEPITPTALTLSPDPLILGDEETGSFLNTVLLSNNTSLLIPSADITYTIANPLVANVSTDGQFTSVQNGNTTVTAQYALNGVELDATADICVEYLEFTWEENEERSITLSPGQSAHVFGCYFPKTGGDIIIVDEDLEVEVNPAVNGVTIEDNGPVEGRFEVVVGESVSSGTTITVDVSYTDPDTGRTFSDVLTINVVSQVD